MTTQVHTAPPSAAVSTSRFPLISVIAAAGLVMVAIADSLGRADVAAADVIFWAGIAMIILPIAVRLLDSSVGRHERAALLVLMGMALYLVKLMHSPATFGLYDEIQHLRTADDILLTGRLYGENPLLLVSPLFPGLEVATSALTTATGTTAFESGVVIVGAARLLLVLGTFLFLAQVTGNDRIAGVATFVYMANPNFLFFDAQFGYESLALGLTVVVLYLMVVSNGSWAKGGAAALLVVGAIIVTHHVTTYALIAFLTLWTVAWKLSPSRRLTGPGPRWLALAAIVGAVAWVLIVARLTIEYLGGRVTDALALVGLLLGDVASRPLFQATGGSLAPAWEQIVAFGSVILLLAALPIGLWTLWRGFRHEPAAIALGIAAMSYPLTLALRLTQQGAEEAGRSSGFVFFGVGLVVALAVTHPWHALQRWRRAGWPALATAGLIIAIGGMIVGVPRWNRIPGPYVAGADGRSIERQGILAAQWARAELGPERRIVADRVNRLLMGLYGRQRPVTNYADQVRTYNLFFPQTFGDAERSLLERGDIEFLVVDRRLAGVQPLAGPYYESGEPREIAQRGGLTLQGLTKFDEVPGVDVIFDSGDITIYDVRAVTTGVRP